MFEEGFVANTSGLRGSSELLNVEKNYGQIFSKAPTITREFLEKINNEMVPRKTAFFGYRMNTRKFIVLMGLILLFTFSTMGTITLWFTDVFRKRIESLFIISENSPGYGLWKAPPVRAEVKIHIFNYTNVEDFERGLAQKLHVQELGPYVYFEKLEKVNIRFSPVDDTVSYQDKRHYEFSPELSTGSPNDLVRVPNVPLLAGAAVVKNFNFLLRVSYQTLTNSLSEKPFTVQRAHNFVNGYDDPLFELSKSYLKYLDQRVFEQFGLLVWKQGIQPDVYTMNTGAHDLNKLGRIEKFNGKTHFDMWGSESCNSIQSSDGIIYPGNQVRAKKDISFFIPQICRKIQAKFVEEVRMLDKVPMYRYKIPLDIFETTSNPENKCYCDLKNNICPPKGLFNATQCTFGAPIFYSWPHFHGADLSVLDSVSGLNKNFPLNNTFLDLHSKFGTMLRGKLKLQINVQVKKSFGMNVLHRYPDGLLLPMAWVEFGVEDKDLPEEVVELIYQITFTVKNLEFGLKYGCLLGSMVTFTCIFLVVKKHRQGRKRTDHMQRSVMDLVI
ncbi:hypothetical protein ABEB36_014362 [Hypothenemus hampei]|uniref:Scavenger receptor class B member 1 n=1 Tax=Hypothenemus hampei TaxID=57062 RepID=A0ABD1E458_HYPHA